MSYVLVRCLVLSLLAQNALFLKCYECMDVKDYDCLVKFVNDLESINSFNTFPELLLQLMRPSLDNRCKGNQREIKECSNTCQMIAGYDRVVGNSTFPWCGGLGLYS